MIGNAVANWNFLHVFPPSERARYWKLTGFALAEIFESPFPIDALRYRIDTSPVEEQIMFFHQPPLILAGLLCGVTPNERHFAQFDALLARL